jgi:hypothetical protein
MRTCECGSELPPLSNQTASLLTAYTFLYETASTIETYIWWRNVIVEQYSALNLTKQTDKLPALSGLAALVREKTQDVYLGGLWLSDLADGLLWELWDAVQAPVQQEREPADFLFEVGAVSASTLGLASFCSLISHTR